jgi:hypothetical protein
MDDPAQIRLLAKSRQNCLSQYLHEVNEGTSLIYRSTEDEQPTAALLARANWPGWALVDIKGSKNIDTHPKPHRGSTRTSLTPAYRDGWTSQRRHLSPHR